MEFKGKILLVDDELSVIKALKRSLFSYDLPEIITTTSPAEALNIVKNQDICLIVSDLRMPNMSGIELLNKIRNEKPLIIRILLTACQDANSAIEAINQGGVWKYLTKPCDPEELLQIIKNGLELYQQNLNAYNKGMNELKEFSGYMEKIIHDAKNKMGNISGCLYFMSKNKKAGEMTEEENQKWEKEIKDQLIGMKDMFENFLFFIRNWIEELKPESINVFDFIHNVLMKDRFQKDLNIVIDLDEVKNISITIDILKMGYAFNNIIENALEAMQFKGELNIKGQLYDDLIVITIRDTGCGMTSEILEKLGTPFITSQKTGRIGLGLVNAKTIIEIHGGKLNFMSKVGEGTSVIIHLPILKK